MKESIKDLLAQWVAVKEQEKEVTAWRREIEDKLSQRFKLNDFRGSKTKEIEGFNVNVSSKITKKVDTKLIQEIAQEEGKTEYLDKLFRWSAAINARAWDKCDPRIIEKFESAVSESVSRPSFKIEKIGE